MYRKETTPAAQIAARTPASYAYLLGMYLGDGCLTLTHRGVYRLRITLDAAYPQIINECAHAIWGLLPANRTSRRPHQTGRAVVVSCHSKRWAELFPQHGPGRKHTRSIVLAEWQAEISHARPEALVRGLIHSDGSRFIANQRVAGRVYSYPRYCFDNQSADIMQIFCDHLDLLGIHWTLARPVTAQVARRGSVAALDQFVGPKT